MAHSGHGSIPPASRPRPGPPASRHKPWGGPAARPPGRSSESRSRRIQADAHGPAGRRHGADFQTRCDKLTRLSPHRRMPARAEGPSQAGRRSSPSKRPGEEDERADEFQDRYRDSVADPDADSRGAMPSELASARQRLGISPASIGRLDRRSRSTAASPTPRPLSTRAAQPKPGGSHRSDSRRDPSAGFVPTMRSTGRGRDIAERAIVRTRVWREPSASHRRT